MPEDARTMGEPAAQTRVRPRCPEVSGCFESSGLANGERKSVAERVVHRLAHVDALRGFVGKCAGRRQACRSTARGAREDAAAQGRAADVRQGRAVDDHGRDHPQFIGAGWEETSWQIRSSGSGCTILRSCTVGDALAATPPGDALLPELELVDGAF